MVMAISMLYLYRLTEELCKKILKKYSKCRFEIFGVFSSYFKFWCRSDE